MDRLTSAQHASRREFDQAEKNHAQESLLSDEERSEASSMVVKPRISTTAYCLTIINSVTFAATVILFLWTLHLRRSMDLSNPLKLISTPSPIYNSIKIPRKTVRVRGTFYTPDEMTMVRREPGPSTNAQWEDIELIRYIPLTSADIIAMGKDPAKHAKIPQNASNGIDDDKYFGSIDVFHKLHCLNELRKRAFETYWGPVEYKPRRRIEWQHLAHCADILYQDLKCNANGDILPSYWVEDDKVIFPNFNIDRQCTDFDALVEWRNAHGLTPDIYVDQGLIYKPEGVYEHPQPALYFELLGPDRHDTMWDPDPSEQSSREPKAL